MGAGRGVRLFPFGVKAHVGQELIYGRGTRRNRRQLGKIEPLFAKVAWRVIRFNLFRTADEFVIFHLEE